MTDLEMIKRCAEKFGFEVYEDQSQWGLDAPAVACKLGILSGQCIVYNPLTDDAQAMALEDWLIERGHLHYEDGNSMFYEYPLETGDNTFLQEFSDRAGDRKSTRLNSSHT